MSFPEQLEHTLPEHAREIMFPLVLLTLRRHCLPLPNVQHHETVLVYILSIFLIVDGGSINAAPVFPHMVEAEMRHI